MIKIIEIDEDKILNQIIKRIKDLVNENEFNGKCITQLQGNKLFNDTKLTTEFIDVIFSDKSLHFFETMMNNFRKLIINVLRDISQKP